MTGMEATRGRVAPTRALIAALVLLGALLAPAAAPVSTEPVLVRAAEGAVAQAVDAVRAAGGHVRQVLGQLDVVFADLPTGRAGELRGRPGVAGVSPDARVRLQHAVSGFDPSADPNSLHGIAQAVGARDWYGKGWTGAGIDVALIDSGIAQVPGLDAPGKVVHGPDLSFESQAPELRRLDTYGHGTHMAGIIAGRDGAQGAPNPTDHHSFAGIAPDARVVSLKVADAQGATDVSQVLAAIDWVVQHRRSGDLNIRVLNLSFGTDATQDYRLDPLAHAVEVAWRKGIVVVVSAGNGGFGSEALNNPALDPFVIAVGAQDTRGTQGMADDVIPPFSSRGDGVRNPDVVAPGISVAGLRVPGSSIDTGWPSARVGERWFRGSGTSQSAAVVSGAVALVLQQHPTLTPDEVKQFLRDTARPLPAADVRGQGAGSVDLSKALNNRPVRGVNQTWERSTGTGSLEAARGSVHLRQGDVVLAGEQDIFGATFDAATHAGAAEAESAWQRGWWNGTEWTGSSWDSGGWAAVTWTRSSWSRSSWSADYWQRTSWSRTSWSGDGWGSTAESCVCGHSGCAKADPAGSSANHWSSGGWG